mmetsp:Transcript_41857/g.84187  ORF Transcript_41857/g.84187 Transcript_41857/m.84187 type:complete len:297 (+) Transcript_41857:526-1416(+)
MQGGTMRKGVGELECACLHLGGGSMNKSECPTTVESAFQLPPALTSQTRPKLPIPLSPHLACKHLILLLLLLGTSPPSRPAVLFRRLLRLLHQVQHLREELLLCVVGGGLKLRLLRRLHLSQLRQPVVLDGALESVDGPRHRGLNARNRPGRALLPPLILLRHGHADARDRRGAGADHESARDDGRSADHSRRPRGSRPAEPEAEQKACGESATAGEIRGADFDELLGDELQVVTVKVAVAIHVQHQLRVRDRRAPVDGDPALVRQTLQDHKTRPDKDGEHVARCLQSLSSCVAHY